MRATLMYGAGDVRVETVPDARLVEPTDALVRVTRSAICGSDLWPYKSMEPTETGRPRRRCGSSHPGARDPQQADAVPARRRPAATRAGQPSVEAHGRVS